MRPLNHLILLSRAEPTAEDRKLLAFASSMGVSAKSLSIQDGTTFIQRVFDEFQSGTYCLAMSADTLAFVSHPSVSGADLLGLINRYSAVLLVFGCTASVQRLSAVSWLTSGAVSVTSSLGSKAVRFAFPREAVSFSRQLAGLSFSGGHGEAIPTFELRNATRSADVIMTANERPVVVRLDGEPCQVFLLTTPLADLDEPMDSKHEFQRHYHQLIPLLIFLRYFFGDSCWHGPESTARLIIDDPLLTERYGFLDHRLLAKSMQRSRYGTSIAFIPWNYWRTSRQNTSRLLSDSSNLAICVHGCDHTNKEFEAQDSALLNRKAGLALRRMESQRKRTGAAFERVMVFPQGRFSTAAIAALRANDYLAVVNTTCFPTNIGPDDLKLGDLLAPAVTRYNGFPIFQRRYPRHLFDFAFDLFLGRPAFVVEHHEYFRDGYSTLEHFVADLYKLDPALSWPTLTDQLTRSCRKRKLSDGSIEIQFFTRRFQLTNSDSSSGRFLLSKHEPDSDAIEKVVADGTSVPFSFETGFLKLEVQADAGQMRNIEIVDRMHTHRHVTGFDVVHNAGVLLRRGLSEFRDNTLARHGGLLKVAKRVAKGLKATGNA